MGWDILVVVGCVALIAGVIAVEMRRRIGTGSRGADGSSGVHWDSDGDGGDGGGDGGD